MEELLKEYLNRKMREIVTPKEMMNRVKLLFPDATMGEDADGQVLINTGVKLIGEGVKERFVPIVTEASGAEDVVDDGKDKPPKT